MNIAIYTLASELHDKQAVASITQEFLAGLQHDFDCRGNDYSDYGSYPLSLIYVQTGGTEGIFRKMFAALQKASHHPFYLLTSGKSNSLAASMEILSYLRKSGVDGEILHGGKEYIGKRIRMLERVSIARNKLRACRLGIIGKPSDWLISSDVDRMAVKCRLGIELVDIPMTRLLDVIQSAPLEMPVEASANPQIVGALPGANQIYMALKFVVEKYQLQGFTLRCFDLLPAVRNTGCLALAKLNAEGVVAGCEGDIPALLSMMVAKSLVGVSGFQANPARIDPETGEILMAHCTIPFNMVDSYELDTHFESGIGVGIRGFMKEGPVTIFKLSGDLARCFVEEGVLVRNQSQPDLCRTQQVVQLSDKSRMSYFLTNPIGNHHIVLPGHWKVLLEEMIR
jgi:L-fucose isomerase and related proteins